MMLEQIRKDINKGNATWIKAFKEKDAELLAKAFHEEGAVLGAGGNITQGREAVQASMGAWMEQIGRSTFTIETLDVYVLGQEIYEKGQYTLTIENGEKYDGKFVVVWKYGKNNRLYFYRDIGV